MNGEVFFSPKTNTIIDEVAYGFGVYSGRTLEQTREDYGGDVIITNVDRAVDIIREANKTTPSEITEDDFYYFLEVLPPCRWKNRGDSESFFMSEFETYDITTHLVRIAHRYFKFDDSCNVTHEEAVSKCMPLFNNPPVDNIVSRYAL
jgi:hypothetical protein